MSHFAHLHTGLKTTTLEDPDKTKAAGPRTIHIQVRTTVSVFTSKHLAKHLFATNGRNQ